jgi:hypothetical protein
MGTLVDGQSKMSSKGAASSGGMLEAKAFLEKLKMAATAAAAPAGQS